MGPFLSSVLAASTWDLAILRLGVEGWAGSTFKLGLVAPQGTAVECLGETRALTLTSGTSRPGPGASGS